MEFDNMFTYGRKNVIDFRKLPGVTGIFAPNRSGKSSVIGTLAYGLFNSTDRGTIKNLHIINSRKGYCKARILIGVNNKNYTIERSSVRHTNKKTGVEHAVTTLNFFQCDEEGNTLRDLNGLQRNDTDKEIRKLIGSFDDFLLTSLSTQFSTNKLITEGATYRKSTLARFLGVDIFEELLECAKKDSDQLKLELKNFADRNWDLQIDELTKNCDEARKEIAEIKNQLALERKQQDEYKIDLSQLESSVLITDKDLDSQKNIIAVFQKDKKQDTLKLKKLKNELLRLKSRLEKTADEKESFDIEKLKKKTENKQEIERLMTQLQHSHKHENSLLQLQKKSIKLLDEVPCGSIYPTCRFIKDSHAHKKQLPSQQKKLNEIIDKLDKKTRELHSIIGENLEAQFSSYQELDKALSGLNVKISQQEISCEKLQYEIDKISDNIISENDKLTVMKKQCIDSTYANKLVGTKIKIRELEKLINKKNDKLISIGGNLFLHENEIEKLLEEKNAYALKRKQWKIYELLLSAFSKKGIPAQIILEQLPAINTEITNLLHGTCDFTLVFESEDCANNMDIYIDYGDSRRLIELASGMEKIIASLAIRVALNNISSLPKTNTLIIDEGFGSLDETQLEACARFLDSLKKKFKNIIIISHVESVKDMVDNLLEITKDKKKNSHIYHE